MKNICLSISMLALMPLLFISCGNNNEKAELTNFIDSASYAFGVQIGSNVVLNFTNDSIRFNQSALIRGFKDAISGLDTLTLSKSERDTIMMKEQTLLKREKVERTTKEAIANKEAEAKFLIENRNRPNIIQTQSGLQYKIIKEGYGTTPTLNDKVVVNYEGKLLNGKIFDSSFERKDTQTFPVNGVILGWQEGLQLMKEGGSYELYIPSNLGYGVAGNGIIPANSTLIFTINLLKVE